MTVVNTTSKAVATDITSIRKATNSTINKLHSSLISPFNTTSNANSSRVSSYTSTRLGALSGILSNSSKDSACDISPPTNCSGHGTVYQCTCVCEQGYANDLTVSAVCEAHTRQAARELAAREAAPAYCCLLYIRL